jgi:hypothetical protein
MPTSIRIRALYVTGDCIRSNPSNQEQFKSAQPMGIEQQDKERQSSWTSSIDHLVGLTVNGGVPFNLRIAALYALECYLYRNSPAQINLLTSILSPPYTTEGSRLIFTNFIRLLFDSIELSEVSRKDPFPCWSACVLLSHCLQSNSKAKEMALKCVLSQEENGQNASPSLRFLSAITHSLIFSSQDQANVRIQLALLSLLCIWMYDCFEAITEFLEEGASLQFVGQSIVPGSMMVTPFIAGPSKIFYSSLKP